MIELRGINYFDEGGSRNSSALNPLATTNPGRRYQKECGTRKFSLIVEGDHPVDSLVFESPEVSLICRADLLEARAQAGENVNEFPAAHLASQYLRQGDEFAKALRGTFAIVLYDHRQRTLKAWTDHFGAQRLVYKESGEWLAISTDLRLLFPLHPHPEIDLATIREYLQYSCIPTPKTIYKDFFKLAPGHQLTSSGRTSVRCYWDMTFQDGYQRKSESAWAGDTAEAIRSAVSQNLTALTNIKSAGCFLSGGTDSSSVAGLVGRVTGDSPRTFSIGFDDPRYNEIEYARIAAKRFHADHHEYFVKPEDILAIAQKAAAAYDEPFGNSSIVPTYYCARLAAEHGVTHLLAGDGGDELFGGNSRYVDDQVFQRYDQVPFWIRRFLIEPVVSVGAGRFGSAFFNRAASYIRRASLKTPDRFLSYSFPCSISAAELYTSDFLGSVNGDHSLDPARKHFLSAPTRSELNRWLYLDLKITITDNDLHKVSTMSRLAGVTVRYPLLDPALAEFTGKIPPNLKVRGTQLRYLFKKAMQDVLPQEIIKKTKHGFGLPYSVWLGETKSLRDLTFDVLGSARCRQRGYFRPDLLDWLWQKYETVHRGYYGEILWGFLMLELWHVAEANRALLDRPKLIPASQLN